MTKRVIGIDLDGVLAKWNESYYDWLVEMTGKDLCPEEHKNPPVWWWPQHFGYTEEEVKATFEKTWADYGFWVNLKPYDDAEEFLAAFAEAEGADDVYFITSRKGVQVKLQTERWLEFYGFGWPTVIIANGAEAKAHVAQGLGTTHFLEDSDENAQAIALACPKTQVFLLDRNYNRHAQDSLKAKGVVVINSILEFPKALGKHSEPASE
jgi:FMN phosphatase YigB (HAD superfamily)